MGAERAVRNSLDMWRTAEHDLGTRSNVNAHSASYFMEGDKFNMTGSQYENGLFSSSLSELFNRKCKLLFPSVYQRQFMCCYRINDLNQFPACLFFCSC